MSYFGSTFGSSTPATQTQQQPTTSIFGQTPGQSGGGGGGGIFGGGTTTTTPGTSGLFGGTTGGSSIFGGQQPQQQPASGLYGGTSTAGTTGTGGGIFGIQQPQQQQQQQQPTSGLFGQSTTTSGTGLFGQTQPQQQQQQPGGLYSQSTTTGSGLFGQTQPQQQQQGGLFGGMGSATTGGGGLLGGTQQHQQQNTGSGWFGGLASHPQPQQQSQFGGMGGMMNHSMQGSQYGQAPGNRVINELKKVIQKWDRTSPDCEFKFYFYNNVGADNASRHVKPPNEDEKAYDKAWTERPSSGAVPVLAIGFGDLEVRVKSQQMQVYAFRTTLHAIQEKLTNLTQKHDLVTSIKLDDCRRRHISLARRALALAAQVQVLKNRGYALQPEEEQLKKKLDSLSKSVFDPSIVGRVNEIWARMMVVRERARMMEGELDMKGGVEWDERLLKTTGELLGQNAKGLEFLTKEVKEIEKELAELQEEMSKGAAGAGQGGR